MEAAGAVLIIVLSLNRTTVGKVGLPKSVKHSVAFVVKFHKMTKFLSLFLFWSLEGSDDDQLDYRDFQKILGKGNEDLIDDIIQLVVADQVLIPLFYDDNSKKLDHLFIS